MARAEHPRKNKAALSEADELRKHAEDLLGVVAAGWPVPGDLAAAVHELRVHQIELEMQNEELRAAQLELDEQRAKYFDLFDRAPVGYLIVGDKDIVGDANLTAAHLLGVERQLLVGQPLTAFVHPSDREVYLHHRMFEKTGEPQTCELRLRRFGDDTSGDGGAGHFWALVESRPQCAAGGETLSWVTFTDIDDGKRAEDSLLVSLQITEDIINAIPVRVFWKDRSLVYLGCNALFASDAGYADPQDIIGKDDFEMVWRDQAELYRDDDRQVIEGGHPRLLIEEIQTTPEGKTLALLTSKTPLRGPEGEVVGVLGTYVDITERKLAEDALRDSEEQYRSFVERATDGIAIIQNGCYVFANPAVAEMAGYSHEEFIGMDFLALVSPENRALLAERIASRLAGEDPPSTYETCLLHKDGSPFTAELSAAIVTYKGAPADMVIVRDVTERNDAEEALRRSEADLKRAQHFAHVGNWTLNVKTNELEGSDEMFRLLGRDRAACFGSLAELIAIAVHPDDRVKVEQSNLSVINNATPTPLEYRVIWPDQSVHTLWTEAGGLVLDEDGNPSLLSGTAQDITERKQAERELFEERERNVDQLAAALSSVIAVVGKVVEARDPYTAGHERRVSELAVRISQEMRMPAQQIEEIRIAALIHDVGKISVPAEILSKPGRLSPVEFELIKGHAESGYLILASANMEEPITEMVYQHHERCDGSGYPRGLGEGELLDGAKVIMVADVVEAMVSHRPYRAGLGVGPALAEIERGAGKQYDAEVAEVCKRVFDAGFAFSEARTDDTRPRLGPPQMEST